MDVSASLFRERVHEVGIEVCTALLAVRQPPKGKHFLSRADSKGPDVLIGEVGVVIGRRPCGGRCNVLVDVVGDAPVGKVNPPRILGVNMLGDVDVRRRVEALNF